MDGTSKARIFFRITLPMISPMIVYLVITGFIGAFKAYSDAVALFGVDPERRGDEHHRGAMCTTCSTATAGGYPLLRLGGGHPAVRHRADHHLHQPAGHPQEAVGLRRRDLCAKRIPRKNRGPSAGKAALVSALDLFAAEFLGGGGAVPLLLDGAHLPEGVRGL